MLSWAPFLSSPYEGKGLTPLKFKMGFVFSLNNQHLPFSDVLFSEPCKTSFSYSDNAKLISGDVINFIAWVWNLLSFGLAFTSCPVVLRAGAAQGAACFSFLFNSLFLPCASPVFLWFWEPRYPSDQHTPVNVCVSTCFRVMLCWFRAPNTFLDVPGTGAREEVGVHSWREGRGLTLTGH